MAMGRIGCSRVSLALLAALLAGSVATASFAANPRDAAASRARALAWMSTDATVVSAVREANHAPSAEARAMTQDKWKALQVLDPFVRGLSKTPLAMYLKDRRDEAWTEVFVSAADGTKVALLNKTTSWSHRGKPKHDVPMQGRVWIGETEVDASSGIEQIQVALPILDGGVPIGSIVIGFSVAKLE
jgi:hypothetical protein